MELVKDRFYLGACKTFTTEAPVIVLTCLSDFTADVTLLEAMKDTESS